MNIQAMLTRIPHILLFYLFLTDHRIWCEPVSHQTSMHIHRASAMCAGFLICYKMAPFNTLATPGLSDYMECVYDRLLPLPVVMQNECAEGLLEAHAHQPLPKHCISIVHTCTRTRISLPAGNERR
eukprot:scpid107716/ scgid14582/ 